METYLVNLLSEKGIIGDTRDPLPLFQESNFIGFNYESLISFICAQPIPVQNQIRNTFVTIDFKNGDVAHFLKHLEKGYFLAMQEHYANFITV